MKINKIFKHLNNSGIPEKSNRLGNQGFSLVELIVAIAIMIVFVAVVIISSSVIDTSRVQEVERGIDDYANLARSKSMSVSAKAWYMEVTTNDDGDYVTRLCKVEEEEVSGSLVDKIIEVSSDVYNRKVTVSFNDGANTTVINKTSPLCVYFNAATGKVGKITVAGTEVDISGGIGRVTIESDSYDATLKFFYNTGKIERE